MQNPKPDELNPSVVEALRLFEEGISLSELSLEQIMMCVYNKPCVRIAPSDLNDTRFGRGSVLVKSDSIIIVLEPDDDSLCINSGKRHARFIAPQRHFDHLLEGSRFYTRNTVTCVNGYEELIGFRGMKAFCRGNSIPVGVSVDLEIPFGGEEGNMLPYSHPRGPEVSWLIQQRAARSNAKFFSEV